MTRSDELTALISRLIQAAREREAASRLPDCIEGAQQRLDRAKANVIEALTRSNELDDPKMLAKIGTAIAEAVGDQGFELSPPQALYAALQAVGAINTASLTLSNDTIEDEPSEAMVEAGRRALSDAAREDEMMGDSEIAERIYKAMRAAITPTEQ